MGQLKKIGGEARTELRNASSDPQGPIASGHRDDSEQSRRRVLGIGKTGKSLEKYEQSFEMRRAIYQEKLHPDIATSLNNLGGVYEAMGKLEKSLEMHEQSFEMYRAIHKGRLHPDIAMSLNNLGTVYYAMGNLENRWRSTNRASK